MICRHELRVRAVCPVDGSLDVYEATVESPAAVMVETILEAAAGFANQKITQETLTVQLAAELGCRVTTVGWHSGVKTTVIA